MAIELKTVRASGANPRVDAGNCGRHCKRRRLVEGWFCSGAALSAEGKRFQIRSIADLYDRFTIEDKGIAILRRRCGEGVVARIKGAEMI